MFILTSGKFIEEKAQESLVGELDEHVGDDAWIQFDDLESYLKTLR
jgi:hypothetical protein